MPLCRVAEVSWALLKRAKRNRYQMITYLIKQAFLCTVITEKEGSGDPRSGDSWQGCYHPAQDESGVAITQKTRSEKILKRFFKERQIFARRRKFLDRSSNFRLVTPFEHKRS